MQNIPLKYIIFGHFLLFILSDVNFSRKNYVFEFDAYL